VDGFPDETIWDYEEGYIRNDEAQYYTRKRKENARVENGNLIINLAIGGGWGGQQGIDNSIFPLNAMKRDLILDTDWLNQ